MAQKTEKEDADFKAVPEILTLCINNCGVTGSPATKNMCQKCFTASSAAASTTSSAKSRRSMISGSTVSTSDLADVAGRDVVSSQDRKETEEVAEAGVTKKTVNRCSGCCKKVGLTGFRCRCGELFCAEHRYSDRHDCSYDYKAAGREAIARENPVVKAAKIVRV
ncbi:hypothetical protein RJ639_004326 [Escallonia herrerae]|uniref:Zinc finger A20 and AN1 domain-containing stress-associated protein 5 n=1 Tax=Escallonia herrerae TaxID=1293975 RepID=A0AA88W507_9ASTE|nr:hypothetical protein RJ639_004326 [Escallonia herrerae]